MHSLKEPSKLAALLPSMQYPVHSVHVQSSVALQCHAIQYPVYVQSSVAQFNCFCIERGAPVPEIDRGDNNQIHVPIVAAPVFLYLSVDI